MTEEKVVALPGYTVPSDEPVDRCVEILSEALALAKSGQIVGVAVVATYKQPLAFGNDYHAEHGTRHTLAAGILALGYMIAREMLGHTE